MKKCNSLTKWKQGSYLEVKACSSYYLIPYQSTVDIDMRWFQFKILNRTLYMKDLLLKFQIVADKHFKFCNRSEETKKICIFFVTAHIQIYHGKNFSNVFLVTQINKGQTHKQK